MDHFRGRTVLPGIGAGAKVSIPVPRQDFLSFYSCQPAFFGFCMVKRYKRIFSYPHLPDRFCYGWAGGFFDDQGFAFTQLASVIEGSTDHHFLCMAGYTVPAFFPAAVDL